MKRNIVLISKSGSVKTQSAKNLVLNELYKKCKLKNSNDFEKRHTWKTHDNYVTIYAKNNGRAGQENKYDLPSPIDTDLYFNSMVVIKHSSKEPDADLLLDFTRKTGIFSIIKKWVGLKTWGVKIVKRMKKIFHKSFYQNKDIVKKMGLL